MSAALPERPRETALRIAETGHLAMATLHTNSTFETINRIVDVFPASQQNQVRSQLAFSLSGVLTQQTLGTTSGFFSGDNTSWAIVPGVQIYGHAVGELGVDEASERALAWRPFRAVAARLLWHEYLRERR